MYGHVIPEKKKIIVNITSMVPFSSNILRLINMYLLFQDTKKNKQQQKSQ